MLLSCTDFWPARDEVSPGRIKPGTPGDRARAHIFEIGVITAWALIGLNYLIDRESGVRSPIGQAMPNYSIWWSCCYVVAAPLILYGIFQAQQRFRVGGLLLLASGLLMQFIAAISVSPIEPRDFVYLVYFAICLIKAWLADGPAQKTS